MHQDDHDAQDAEVRRPEDADEQGPQQRGEEVHHPARRGVEAEDLALLSGGLMRASSDRDGRLGRPDGSRARCRRSRTPSCPSRKTKTNSARESGSIRATMITACAPKRSSSPPTGDRRDSGDEVQRDPEDDDLVRREPEDRPPPARRRRRRPRPGRPDRRHWRSGTRTSGGARGRAPRCRARGARSPKNLTRSRFAPGASRGR